MRHDEEAQDRAETEAHAKLERRSGGIVRCASVVGAATDDRHLTCLALVALSRQRGYEQPERGQERRRSLEMDHFAEN